MNRIYSVIKLQSIAFFKMLFLTLLLNSAAGAGVGTTLAGIHTLENGQVCTNCHNFDEGNKNSIPDVLPAVIEPDNSNLKESGNAYIQSVTAIQGGGQDCVFCHDISRNGAPPDKRIDASAIKQGVHRNLNNATINTTVLSDLIDKACWACHGNATEPGQHPDNYKTPYVCTDCHNATYSLDSTNPGEISNLTMRKVYEHIPPPYYQEINSILSSSNATCTGCHDKSMINYADSGFSIASNVSHYASRMNLVIPTNKCSLCHKNPVNASAYWANLTRHAAKSPNDSFCANCHNTTLATDLHSQPLVKPLSIHFAFDWNNNDYLNGPDSSEACFACHSLATEYKRCEDCHLDNGSGPINISGQIRSDYNDTIPRIYAHTNYSAAVNVPNQSGLYSNSIRPSSCFSGNSSGRTCHGNAYSNRGQNGGFYAYNAISSSNGAPYHYAATIDKLPNTTNCLFCHKQNDTTIRKAWGNATQIIGGTHNWYTGDDISKCWGCHVSTGTAPKDFHSDTMRAGGGTDCIACHSPSDVNISLFGRHANVNTSDGPGNVTNNDCWTCHYKKDMNRSQVYLCDSCHMNTSGVVQVTDPALILGDFYHGPIRCKYCHAPVTYHMKGKAGPKGAMDPSVFPKN